MESNADVLQELFDYINTALADEQNIQQNPNQYLFSILLMLNTFSILGKEECVYCKSNWIEESRNLLNRLDPDLKTIFTHYYYASLENLNLLDQYEPDARSDMLRTVEDYLNREDGEISYMGYSYLIDLALRLDRVEQLPVEISSRVLESIGSLYDGDTMPSSMLYGSPCIRLAYALHSLSKLNSTSKIFDSIDTGNAKSQLTLLLENHEAHWEKHNKSVAILCNALIDVSLSMRDFDSHATVLEQSMKKLPLMTRESKQTLASFSRPGGDSLSALMFFPMQKFLLFSTTAAGYPKTQRR